MRAPLLAILLLTAGLAGCLTDNGSAGGPGPAGGGADGSGGERYAPGWPAKDDAPIRPGVPLGEVDPLHDVNGAGNCTSNFIFSSPDNRTLYIGTAAHCTDGLDIGDEVTIAGGEATGVHAYNSWHVMEEIGESSESARAYNDFSLIRIRDEDRDKVHPAVRQFAGPTGVADESKVTAGDKILSYGNSALRGHVEPTSWKEGYVDSRPDPWTVVAYMATPGIPGDSGSAAMTADGEALGIVVTVSARGTNGITTLDHALAYAREKGGMYVDLATWDLEYDGHLPE